MKGKLVKEGGCLRVEGDGHGHLIIWPYDYTVTAADGGTLEIHDGGGTVVVRVGDTVRVSGGEVPSPQPFIATAIPNGCEGPYWVAGSEVERVTEE